MFKRSIYVVELIFMMIVTSQTLMVLVRAEKNIFISIHYNYVTSLYILNVIFCKFNGRKKEINFENIQLTEVTKKKMGTGILTPN